ncbi:SIR2 family protein [Avibacterium avium]|uniref:SIR2 family protein n=1 Tax=Avibacterium avium TaxID=751 RepID=UPI003BF77C21
MKKEYLIKELVKELNTKNLAIFAGAGLSTAAGYVDWKGLLKDIADELGLYVDQEDLILLAQYYVNSKCGNRSKINELIIDELSVNKDITENHQILARLPIDTFWTTNYDSLIEKSLESIGKVVDVKHRITQLSYSKTKRDAVVYKMHGDVSSPDEAVLIKDDYEKYFLNRNDFFTILRADLLTKRFLFLGFSFSDPNIDYILSRIRVSYDRNQKRHFCILKQVQKEGEEEQADFEYRKRKQEFFIKDLERVGIDTLLVNEYHEITEILREVEQAQKRKTIFISGAAHDYSPYAQDEVEKFVAELAEEILKMGFRIVTGFGLGIGSSVISGSIKYLMENSLQISEDYLVIRPFPQNKEGEELWSIWRKDMISYAGISIFLFGNKLENENIILSNGMQEEFDISKENGNILIPVACTGYISQNFWEIDMNMKGDERIKNELEQLNSKSSSEDKKNLGDIKSQILEILKKVK